MNRLLVACALLFAVPSFASATEAPQACAKGENCDCAQPDAAAPSQARVTVDTSNAPSFGPSDAKVTLVVFSDFQCPFCRRAVATVKALEARYGNQLRVVFKNRPLPRHSHARLAALAALAAQAQGHFWEFHDWLFSTPVDLDRDALVAEAGRLGLDTARFQADLDGARYEGQLESDEQEAKRLDVEGTPTFFINGLKVTGARPEAEFETLIDAELAG
jgi:protein-disulfide isomerase